MKNKSAMTKLTPAQAYAAQLKADRRDKAAERRNPSIKADDARIKAMYSA